MGGGVFFFVEKVENVFFVKKTGPCLSAGCTMYRISIFISHFTYLGPFNYGPVYRVGHIITTSSSSSSSS